MYGIKPENVLKHGTPIYTHEGNVRHVATIFAPILDYGRKTASYYEIHRHDMSYGVVSADFIEIRHEGRDAMEFHRFQRERGQ